ncbi:hypothetical protein ACWXWU_06260 [Shewanella sp. A14]
MYAQKEKPTERNSRAIINSVTQKQSDVKQTLALVDNRAGSVAQRNLQDMVKPSKKIVQLVTSGNTSHFDKDSHKLAKEEAYRRKICTPTKLATRFRDAGISSGHKMVLSMISTTQGKTKFILVVSVTLGALPKDDHVSYITAYHSISNAARGEPNSTYINI